MKYYEVDFSIKPANNDAADILAALSGDTGFESFNHEEGILKGYVQRDLFDEQALERIISDFPIEGLSITYKVKEAEDRDWNEEWEESGFRPIIIDERCSIHDTRHLPEAVMPIDITIDAKLAFGTGTHETTRMITECLLNKNVKGYSVLDCGCGTGILSFVASKCGAESVTGYDIDEWSVKNTEHNSILNGVNNLNVMEGDVSVLSHICGVFDIVMANINRNTLIQDLPKLKEVLNVDGIIILSGFYIDDYSFLIDKAKELGLSEYNKNDLNDWCMIAFK